ncbi:MAG TPA: hypothetical protein DCY13_03365 [Verrucomicrobiales bacterium]|nr:hypothetical protein [Verrucomicrobiales bacterium]
MTAARSYRFLFAAWLTLAVAGESSAADGSLIRPGDVWRYVYGTQAQPSGWQTNDFDDAGWKSGPAGFSTGFGSYDEATLLPGFVNNSVSLFLRRSFAITNLDAVVWPVLRINYDDAFVAYLNGTEIARRGLAGNPGEPVSHTATAVSGRSRELAEEIDLQPFRQLFLTGTNTLALQVHNLTISNTSLAVVPELLSGITRGPFLQDTSSNRTLVVWKTALPASSRVEFGPTTALGMSVESNLPTNRHALELTGLAADTEYHFRVTSTAANGAVESRPAMFRTLKPSGGVRFLVVGDTGVGQPAQHDVARQMAARPADLVLHAGDIVYPQFTTGRVDSKLFQPHHESMSRVPWFFCIGNHDLYAGETHYLEALHLPANSPAGGERYYSFDHGDVHFTVLMIPYVTQYRLTPGDPQHQWLTNDLAASTKPWKVLLFHVPMQTSANHRIDDWNLNGVRDSEEIREVLLPIAAAHGVQVTFSGHDHVFERFAPTNGVHTIITGGGGVGLYGFVERDAASVQFWRRHHLTEVTVTGDRMEITAIDRYGEAFDSQVIHRAPPGAEVHQAAWHTPLVESAPSNDGDGNLNGQRFDFAGVPLATLPGRSANLGEVFVNNDKSHLHIGLARALLRDDSVVYLFVESPRLAGVTSLAGLGNGIADSAGQGADGLDLLENLHFADFNPCVGLILGDELADSAFRSLQRPAQSLNTGQGVFRLNASLDEVGARLQQFNRSPQTGPVNYERNADFMEVSIPYSALGGLRPGDVIRVGGVVAGGGHDPSTQRQPLDTAFLGTAVSGSGTNDVVLTGVRVQLAPDPDRDGDGLPNDWELAHGFDPDSVEGEHGADGDIDGDGAGNLHEFFAGTNPRDGLSVLKLWFNPLNATQLELRWRTEAGLTYQLEAASNGGLNFAPIGGIYFPRTGTGGEDAFTNDTTSGSQLFRIQRVQ